MNDLTKVSDPSLDLTEQSAAEPASGPEQISDDSLDAAEGAVAPPSSGYAVFSSWPWPELFDGFDEFLKKSREESSANRREPPPWW